MIKRPKPGEDEDDLLRMQEEFLREKSKNNYQPAAQVTNLRRSEPTKRPNTSDSATRKPSKYAQSKGLKNQEKRMKTEVGSSRRSLVGDIFEKNAQEQTPSQENEDDNVYYPKIIPKLLGDIVEKNVDRFEDLNVTKMPLQGFPVATKRDLNIAPGKKSIQSQEFEKKHKKPGEMEVDEAGSSNVKISNYKNLPTKSYILSSNEANDIHNENIKLLNTMSENEILEEQQKLLCSLDPKLIEFIKAKRKLSATETKSAPSSGKRLPDTDNFKQYVENKMDISESMDPGQTSTYDNDSLWENDVLSHPLVNKWLHFESLEKDKLEWMKGIEESKKINTEEPYEARFDFKGYLLPYTMEYTENTKTLFHHGEEPHRPGYSLTELFELSRSTITQQRVMALNTLAGVLEYYSAGTYKDVLEIPLSKFFFVIRIAMDENKTIILEPALKAMRNLLYNRIDEACLDALLGFEEGTKQPCLENDKSEIKELESKESELKDFHLAEIDIIAALLRTDILQRLYYILETVQPSFNCVQYALQILTRLARDSVETTMKIVQAENLMQTIIKCFVPITSINFAFNPQIVYNGKPVLAAIKLLRILSLQSQEIGHLLVTKYNILKAISEYVSSGVDGTYGLRIQIEAFCILSNLLNFGVGLENALSLSPIVGTCLHKHVQGTDIFINSSVISATHCAVILQFVNKLLSCDWINLHNYKQVVYPLIKEGTQKWMAQLAQSENYTCAHLRLMCAALDCCKTMLLAEKMQMKFLNDSLKNLVTSRGYKEITKNLTTSSNLLSGIENKDLHLVKNLMSLAGSVIDSAQKVLPLLSVLSPIPFLASLFNLLTLVTDKDIATSFLESISTYLNILMKKSPSICDNWFTRIETDFVFAIVKLSVQNEIPESKKDLFYTVASKLCYILRIDKIYELDYLFNNVVFNKQWFTAERLLNLVSLSDADGFSKALTSIEDIKICYSMVVNLNYKNTGPNVVLRKWQEPILPRDWIYLPILSLYSRSQEVDSTPTVVGDHAKRVAAQNTAEKEFIVTCSLEWILFNELCFPDLLNDIEITDRLCRIMCVFLCDNSLFLDKKIKLLLQKCTQILFKKNNAFNFDKPLVGLNNFQDFYTQFLEQFQSVSYGDYVFAACVLVPLAQRHNIKWRKLLWSEYAGCLRALDCPEAMLCYEINDYFYPEETDESLIRSYSQALSGNLLRPNTISYRIASHHVEAFKKQINKI
ncbi:RNA polymerase II-associated protein 1 [Hyposmocoma kahamanoa]|uniref:RNA polymerase II-associated protein 1 n=1 Tax=Hyposmocoma kahamanoa TaxID=1477025 RepID=UPI000E6D6F45|nr:RNA polymerase II-associated protein 1 [Hyposmocoma kahamanoa]